MNKVKIISGVVISLIVICFIFFKLDWAVVNDVLSSIQWIWLAAGFLIYIINFTVRAYRLHLVLQLGQVNILKLMGVTCLYGMYVYIMPSKLGELSYPLLLKRYLDVSIPKSASGLVAIRYFDFATIAQFIPIILLIYWDNLPDWFLYGCIIFLGIVLVVGITLIRLSRVQQFPVLFTKITTGARWAKVLDGFICDLIINFRLIGQNCHYLRLWLVTILVWLLVYANFFMIVSSLGYELSYFQMIVVSILMIPMTLLPFQGFANLGSHEIGWVLAFSIFNYPASSSLSLAVSSHILILFFALMIGFIGILFLNIGLRSEIYYDLKANRSQRE